MKLLGHVPEHVRHSSMLLKHLRRFLKSLGLKILLSGFIISLVMSSNSLDFTHFLGLALIGISSVTDPRGIVVGLEYPDLVHYWEKIGVKHAQRVGLILWFFIFRPES